MFPYKTQNTDSQFAERLSNTFHIVLVAVFALLTSNLAIHIAAKLV